MLLRLVKDPIVTAQIYDMIYHKASAPKKDSFLKVPDGSVVNKPNEPAKFVPQSDANNLKEQLNYLKTKPNKSKQDKDSIGILEAVLKNKS